MTAEARRKATATDTADGRDIQVLAIGNHLPGSFLWRGRRVGVSEILDDWEEAGCWWLGEEPRRVYRVLGSTGARYELHRQESVGWKLHRVFD